MPAAPPSRPDAPPVAKTIRDVICPWYRQPLIRAASMARLTKDTPSLNTIGSTTNNAANPSGKVSAMLSVRRTKSRGWPSFNARGIAGAGPARSITIRMAMAQTGSTIWAATGKKIRLCQSLQSHAQALRQRQSQEASQAPAVPGLGSADQASTLANWLPAAASGLDQSRFTPRRSRMAEATKIDEYVPHDHAPRSSRRRSLGSRHHPARKARSAQEAW